MPLDALIYTAPALTSVPAVTGAREAALASLGLFTAAVGYRLAKPVMRRRHARLVGAAPADALLLAGLGEVVRPASFIAEPVVAITVLPSRTPPASERPAPRVLSTQDAELAARLGTTHPMNAPGRHRTVPAWAAGLSRTCPPPSAAVLLEVSPEEEILEVIHLAGAESSVESSIEPAAGSETEVVAVSAETSAGSSGSTADAEPSRAQARYAIDWGEDLDWGDVDGVHHPDGWAEGWVAAATSAGTTPPGTTPPDTAPADTTPAEPPSTLSLWRSSIEEADIAFGRAAEVPVARVVTPPPARMPVIAMPDVAVAPATTQALPEPAPDWVAEPATEWVESAHEWVEPATEWTEPETDVIDEPVDHPAWTAPWAEAEAGTEIEADPVAEPVVWVPTQRAAELPAVHDALAAIRVRLAAQTTRLGIAEVVTQEARALIEADQAVLVVRSIEGPQVLGLDPSATEIWGPQTLAALLTGVAMREVLAGDPLADGGSSALLVVPVAGAGAFIGAVIARREGERPFEIADQDLLDRLARIAGSSLDALTRRGVLRSEGQERDSVTGLAPASCLTHDLKAALNSRDDHGMVVTLVMAEIDGLARMRTEHGDETADEALHLIAHTLHTGLRVGDVAYRLDTEELAVMLAATDVESGERVAIRLVDEVDTALAESYGLDQPLRLRPVVVPVQGSPDEVLAEGARALAAQRVQARWEHTTF
ncbi:MAG: diguanylate cyclase [Kineosporiaceae bacterium]|nr:diguanylate cyclase [Kineosporiaceae bacterium]MBK8075225.1 diguanylate cyclase [Kineosporiaceae bacterium]